MTGFSVVITTFNRETECRRAVESVLSQECKVELEIIVINDGSSIPYNDEWFSDRVSKYKVIENCGMCGARNIGFRMATHEWVALLDDDDWWLPSHITALQEGISKYGKGAVMLHTQASDFFEGGRVVKRPFGFRHNEQSDLDFILSSGYRLPSATCYLKSAVLEFPFEGDDNFSEDYWHGARLIASGRCISLCKYTVMYNQVSLGATRGSDLRTYHAAIDCFSEMLSHPDFKSVRPSVLRSKLGWWYYFGLHNLGIELSRSDFFRASKGLILFNNHSSSSLSKRCIRTINNSRLISRVLFKRLKINFGA